jgi:hypothetical protein
VNVIRYIIDPIMKANMTAAKLIILARNHPISGMNLNSAIIGEKSKYVPQQNRIQVPKRKKLEIIAFSAFRLLIISFLKTIPGFITFTTSWKPFLKSFSMHPEKRQQ